MNVSMPAGLDLSNPAVQLLISLGLSLLMSFLKSRFPQIPWPAPTPAPGPLPVPPASGKHPLLDAIRAIVDQALANRPPVKEQVAPAAPTVEQMEDGSILIRPMPAAKS